MLDEDIQSLGSEDDDEDLISSDGSLYEGDLGSMPVNDDVAHQLAAAGPVGVAAAAAIASSKKRKRPHCFETNPSVRKRQQNRLLRKLRGIIYEFTGRVGKQAVVLVATPGKPNTSYKVFGAKPLEDVLRNLKNIVMDELDNALAQQAPPPPQDDPSLFELPGLVIDGIPTPVEKMTQAQLRAFIPLMLKYSTGRGKPGWGRESTRPPWWPKELPWANVRMDARSEDDKQKISWTHALRKIVINCYKYHGREDLLPTFADDEDKVNALISQSGDEDEDMELSNPPTIHTVTTMTPPTGNSNQPQQVNVVKINSAGTVITTHTAQSNTPAPTIIQSTNNQHVTTTATLPASTKIEICQAPTQQQQQQQQQQHHQQNHQQQQHHQTHLPSTVHIQPVAGGQPQTIQLTTASGTATATAVPTTAAAVSAAQAQAQAHSHSHAHSQAQAHSHSQSSGNQTVTAQQIANAQVCIEPITLSDVDYTTQTVLSQNADGTVSLIQVDPNNPIITLPDGTTAQVQGVATLHQGEGGATIQTVQSLTDVNGHENMTVDLTETQDGQIYITTEDGQGYPVSVSNVISVPVSMYQSVMANMQQIQTNSDGTVCLAPMQVDTSANRTTTTAASSSSSLAGNGGVQCYSLISTGSAVLGRRSGALVGQQVAPGGRYYLATATTSSSTTSSSSFGQLNNNNSTLANNNNSIKMPMPMPIVLAAPSIPQVASTRTTRRGVASGGGGGGADGAAAGGGGVVMVQKRRKPNASSKSRTHLKAGDSSCSSGNSSSIRCVDSASLTSVQIQLPAIKLEHLE
ncbi:DNA-binding protein Ewg isoform X2 [Drosophila suzukii]|uniref:DNA-binding protein Ewg isoform X2 n=1 Tax=Drosophila suzukii TaxID=28584 RepID=A0AB39ZMM1_DROSZ|nr:DNA-binding protein Ewg [Drosophila suzukii]